MILALRLNSNNRNFKTPKLPLNNSLKN